MNRRHLLPQDVARTQENAARSLTLALRKQITRKHFLAATAALGGTWFLSACSTGNPAPTQQATSAAAAVQPPAQASPAAATKPTTPRRGGTLTVGTPSPINDFNPFYLSPGNVVVQAPLYNTLTHYDDRLAPQPELAEKWERAADGKSITVKLREGVKFHSGREVTSEDVKFSAEFAATDTSVFLRPLLSNVKKVETPQKYVAELRFDSPTAVVFDILDTLYIIDKDSVKKFSNQASGTGPFKLDKYVPNDRVELVANKDYWDKDKPYLDKFIHRPITDLSALSLNLESGTIDCVFGLTLLDVGRLGNSGGKYLLAKIPGYGMFDVAISVRAEPFNIKKVRQAVAWSIDRDRFCKTALQGLVQPTCLMWPTSSWAYFKDLEGKIGYDLDKAKALLKEAGLGNGVNTDIITSTMRGPGNSELAQILQADLKKIGVNATINDVDTTVFQNLMGKGDIRLMIHGYARTNRDPLTLVTGAKPWLTEKEGGMSHFESVEYDQLRRDLQTTIEQSKRLALCRSIQEMMLDECFCNPVCESPSFWVYASRVKGLNFSKENSMFAGEVWLEG
ncbi:MAG: ABC transporter substrate-binding protein [Chloroflexi bacterium]|nr:ABC transporter substrate-binding protein [Chloroflexota bacterium]MCL5109457.1 ABC transporter substrate-binding protein [Chloroflexota bacterium]